MVLTLDVNKNLFGKYNIYKSNGSSNTKIEITNILRSINYDYVGEVVLNCIHRDGTKEGFDMNLLNLTYPLVRSNYTLVGGCSNFEEIERIFKQKYPIGLGAGSFVVFKGKFDAVLISYPIKELNQYHFQN